MSKIEGLVGAVIFLLLAVVFTASYVINIIELIDSPVIGIEEVLQVIGVFVVPLGALMGIITL